jgi:hypothetical protein
LGRTREPIHRRLPQHVGGRPVLGIDRGGGAGDAVLSDFDDGGAVQLPGDDLIDIAFGETRAGNRRLAQIVAQVVRHGDGLVAHFAQILFIIAAGQVARILQHSARAVRKPELHAILE